MTNSEIANIRGLEFSQLHRRPGKYVLYRMNIKNHWLSFRESRPDMYNKRVYTAWLIERQHSRDMPDKPYGYYVQERLEQVAPFAYNVHHEIVPRIAPGWISNDKLLKHDPETV